MAQQRACQSDSARLDQSTCLAQQRACEPPGPRGQDLSTCVAHQRACHLFVEELQQWYLDGPLNSQSRGEQTLRHDGDVDDRDDELHLRDLHGFLNCLEHERLSLHTTGTTTLSKSCTWGIATESAQFALCVPVCSRCENCRSLSLHEAATSTTVEELQQRQFHGFLYCLDQPHLSSTATGMSTPVQELPLDQSTCRCTQQAKKLSKNCTCGIATEQREGHRHQQKLRNFPFGPYRP